MSYQVAQIGLTAQGKAISELAATLKGLIRPGNYNQVTLGKALSLRVTKIGQWVKGSGPKPKRAELARIDALAGTGLVATFYPRKPRGYCLGGARTYTLAEYTALVAKSKVTRLYGKLASFNAA